MYAPEILYTAPYSPVSPFPHWILLRASLMLCSASFNDFLALRRACTASVLASSSSSTTWTRRSVTLWVSLMRTGLHRVRGLLTCGYHSDCSAFGLLRRLRRFRCIYKSLLANVTRCTGLNLPSPTFFPLNSHSLDCPRKTQFVQAPL